MLRTVADLPVVDVVAGGVVTDFGAAGAGTWDDTKQLAGDIGYAAGGVWHGITSLF